MKTCRLTLKVLVSTDNIFIFFIFFRENKAWHCMWIVCLADDSRENAKLCEMPSIVFPGNNNNIKK